MSKTAFGNRTRVALCVLAALTIPWSSLQASRSIEERRPADPRGEVEVINLAGSVEVDGWDRNEVEVSGTAGPSVDSVEVSVAGKRTSIRVVSRAGQSWGSDSDAKLIVHVPAASAVTANLVSADFKVTGVAGDIKVQTVSGGLKGEAGGDVRASTVSGEVRLTARAAKNIEVKTISGDVQLTGGGGEVEVTTVSGNATLTLTDVNRARFKTVSGDISAVLSLAADGQIEGESVSGDLGVNFAAEPAAEVDVQSFSGNIKSCFGPKPVESQYGPGSRLQFTLGEGRGRVRIATKSGDVRLCTKNKQAAGLRPPVHALTVARIGGTRWVLPYVF
jgi:DUF4097 and DUF4098 domain-containing protein YvlB